MQTSARTRVAALALVAIAIAACETSTTHVDRAARAKVLENAPYNNILVVGVAYRADSGRAFEKVMVEELVNYKTGARGMHTVRLTTELDDALVREAAMEIGADAVLVSSVEHVDTDVKVGNKRVDIKEQTRSGGLVDFFRRDYKEITQAPTVQMKLNVKIVTNVYDVESGNRIYTIESATEGAKTPEEIIRAESSAIAERMHKDGIIR